jgi:hypothetical protein
MGGKGKKSAWCLPLKNPSAPETHGGHPTNHATTCACLTELPHQNTLRTKTRLFYEIYYDFKN